MAFAFLLSMRRSSDIPIGCLGSLVGQNIEPQSITDHMAISESFQNETSCHYLFPPNTLRTSYFMVLSEAGSEISHKNSNGLEKTLVGYPDL